MISTYVGKRKSGTFMLTLKLVAPFACTIATVSLEKTLYWAKTCLHAYFEGPPTLGGCLF